MTKARRNLGLTIAVLGALALAGAARAADPAGATGADETAAPTSASSGMTSSDLPPPPGAANAPDDTVPQIRGSNGGPTPLSTSQSDSGSNAGADANAQAAPGADTSDGMASGTGQADTGAPQADTGTSQLNTEEPATADGQAAAPSDAAPPGGAVAVLRGLNKITARVTVIDAPIDKPVMFGKLRITARYCYKNPPEEQPEVSAFIQIDDTRQIEKGEQKVKMKLAEDKGEEVPAGRIFSGWMFASSPALNALEHPVYDVWLIDCKASSPDSDFGTAPKVPQVKEEDSKHIK